MNQLIVTLDGTDHRIGAGEITLCNLPVPHGSTREDKAKECKVCFADDVNLQEHVDARRLPETIEDEEPAKPKKATKAA